MIGPDLAQAANDDGPPVVLVVDDDPVAAAAIAAIVASLGHEVSVAHSWTEALRRFSPQHTDLVLMDAVMPNVDGFKLTRLLRARTTSYVPIVFLTGLSDRGSREACVAAGADDFLSKPVDRLELSVRLTAMLRIRVLTQRLEAQSLAMARLARYDSLTGVGNRLTYDERLAAEIARSRRHDRPLALLMMDIDHFKLVNDTYGHRRGDEILAAFGAMLTDITRACDYPCRYGGEEFAVIATETTTANGVHLAERIRTQFRDRTYGHGVGTGQTVSIGVCGSDALDGPLDAEHLKDAADTALYSAKENGRDRVVSFRPSLRLRAV